MNNLSKTIMWAGITVLAALCIMCIVGACLGTARAARFFTSIPLVVYWTLLGLLLISAFILSRRLTRSMGLFAAHIGPLLVLLGGMHGSRLFYNYARAHLGETRIRSGTMVIPEVHPLAPLEAHAVSGVRPSEPGQRGGHLPFALALRKFHIEYHDEDKKWLLGVIKPAPDGGGEFVRGVIDWREGKGVYVPAMGATVTVLQYLHNAQWRPGRLEVTGANGAWQTTPAEVGGKVEVGDPRGTLTINRVFTHLYFDESGRQVREVNLDWSHARPALEVEFEPADGEKYRFLVFEQGHPDLPDSPRGLKAMYAVPGFREAEDTETSLPAMDVLVRRGDQDDVQMWLWGTRNMPHAISPLPSMATTTPAPAAHEGHHDDMRTYLLMARPSEMPKQYYSQLAVLEDGKNIGEKTISVNNPLHYGGYHFYQAGWDNDNAAYTVVNVRYDAGWQAVYVGMILMCTGAFWLFWIRPAWNYFRKRPAS